MKKIMIAAAIAAYCGAVSATGIESQNVVGYTTVPLVSGEYNTGINGFLEVGKTKETCTLGSITLANAASAGSVLQFVAPDGSTLMIDHEQLGEVFAAFYYITPEEYKDVGASEPGWYLQDDGAFEYPMNDYVVPYGTGFMIDCSDDAASIVYAGQVLTGSQEIALTSGEYNMTGNASPLSLTLGDMPLANAASAGSVLQFVAPDSSTLMIDHEQLGEVFAAFYYITPEEYKDVGASEPGWYLQDDGAFEYPMNDYSVPVGTAFMIDCSDDAASLVIPQVLPAVTE